MAAKPGVAAGYSPAAAQQARSTCLYIATKLGDLRDDLVIVGGLVPGLIVPQEALPAEKTAHLGTMDVDLGLAIAILNERRYHELSQRLRQAGFQPDVTSEGRTTSQRWRIEVEGRAIAVDFLIPASHPSDSGGRLKNLEEDFAAIITPGLELAFQDKHLITLTGETIRHEQASRELYVCGAGAFTVLKALAFRNRGENKDAYDLIYILQNYGAGIHDIFTLLQPLLDSPFTQEALTILADDFHSIDSVGPLRLAEFLNDHDDALRADAAGAVRSLLKLCGR